MTTSKDVGGLLMKLLIDSAAWGQREREEGKKTYQNFSAIHFPC